LAVDFVRRIRERLQARARSQALAAALADNEVDFKRALVQARIDAGLTQEDIAARIGTHPSVIAKFERLDSNPRLSMIRYYAHALGIAVRFTVTDFEWEQAA
jgi:ribosome-binding protein aMBF1 (putative translation factor)